MCSREEGTEKQGWEPGGCRRLRGFTAGAQGCFGDSWPRRLVLGKALHVGAEVIGTSRPVRVPAPRDHAHMVWSAVSQYRRLAANLLCGSQGSFHPSVLSYTGLGTSWEVQACGSGLKNRHIADSEGGILYFITHPVAAVPNLAGPEKPKSWVGSEIFSWARGITEWHSVRTGVLS